MQLSRSTSLHGSSIRIFSLCLPAFLSRSSMTARCAISFLGMSIVVSIGVVFWEGQMLSIDITDGRYPLFLLDFKAFNTPMAVMSLAQNTAEGLSLDFIISSITIKPSFSVCMRSGVHWHNLRVSYGQEVSGNNLCTLIQMCSRLYMQCYCVQAL